VDSSRIRNNENVKHICNTGFRKALPGRMDIRCNLDENQNVK